jgi:hypothetical protein
MWKYSSPTGFDLRTVQPVAKRYTKWATPIHVVMCLIIKRNDVSMAGLVDRNVLSVPYALMVNVISKCGRAVDMRSINLVGLCHRHQYSAGGMLQQSILKHRHLHGQKDERPRQYCHLWAVEECKTCCRARNAVALRMSAMEEIPRVERMSARQRWKQCVVRKRCVHDQKSHSIDVLTSTDKVQRLNGSNVTTRVDNVYTSK